jgi:selenocysteine lyase/cysteine desulfurase
MNYEEYFRPFRENIVGIGAKFISNSGEQDLVYADWTASGRLYTPIERKMLESFGPFVGNTHSESSVTGGLMTHAYHHAHEIIKRHVHADADDVLLFVGAGMTAAINKFQRILGVKIPEKYRNAVTIPENDRPVVFVTHMEHHSNQTTWYETIADVCVLDPAPDGLVDAEKLREALKRYKDRTMKIGSFSACSNVTGIFSPYHALAKIMHEHGGIAIIDFAASAPYVRIDMHPSDPQERLDAVIFSPHKFLGGPGTPGVLLFNKHLYTLESPDQPGGGTVLWTNPWGQHKFSPDIEVREDGGTPGFLQAIKASLAVQLKDHMGVENIAAREHELCAMMFEQMRAVPHLTLLADGVEERLCMFSFYFDNIHYNLAVKLLNDRFGIQARGGCSCAGTYGHFLLHVDKQHSKSITDKIDAGDLSEKPGWVRISLHPTTTNAEVRYITNALAEIQKNIGIWKDEYAYDPHSNEYHHKQENGILAKMTASWFEI